jgi:hypothetical protein
MKVYLDEKEILEITQTDLDLLGHDLLDVQGEIERRIQWVISHKCEQIYNRMKAEWTQRFLDADTLPPKTREAFVAVVKAQPTYKDRAAREAEAKALMDAQVTGNP